MGINMFPLWATILGGSSAALSRAGIRQGDMHFIALTSEIYHTDKAGKENRCVRSKDGCAHFLSLTPQSALWKSLGSSQAYVYFATGAVLTVTPRCTQTAGNSSKRVPNRATTGAAAAGVLGQEMHLCPPSLAREDLQVISKAEVPPAAQKDHFNFLEGYLQPAKRTYSKG